MKTFLLAGVAAILAAGCASAADIRIPSKAPYAAPTLPGRRPQGQHQRQEPDQGRRHPMTVLEEDPPDHGGHEHAVGEWPIRHGQGGLGAGDEPADE